MPSSTNLYFIIIILIILIIRLHIKKKSLSYSTEHLREANAKLLDENNQLSSKIKVLTDELDDANKALEQNEIRKNKYSQEKQEAKKSEEEIRHNLSEYFYVKESVMTLPETDMFWTVTKALRKILDEKTSKLYQVFPQVSLYAFIAQNSSIAESKKSLCLSILGGKHTDFIICRRNRNNFEPVIMIELDDISHFQKKYDSFEITQTNDQLKNDLIIALKKPSLLRYKFSNKLSDEDKNIITDALCKIFHDYYNDISGQVYYYAKSGALTEEQYYGS